MMRMPFKARRTRNRIKAREAAARPSVPWRAIARAVAAGATALVTLCVVFWALNQPIRTVEVTGRFQHVLPADIERIVAREVRGQGLLTVHLGAVSRAIHVLPWVDAVSVERDWPHGLSVLVVEQVAAARWGSGGLVNGEGVLFATGVTRFPAGLARLSGPDGSEAEVTQRYLVMKRRLAQAGLAITAMRLDARGAWQLDLVEGITVRLGRSQVDERFEKFMSAALGIVEHRAADISYVDMRYTNGFAIGWRSGRAGASARPILGLGSSSPALRAVMNRSRRFIQRGHSTCPRSGERPCTDAWAGGTEAGDGQWHRANEGQYA